MMVWSQKLARWRGICGVDSNEDIDYSNPIISTEVLLCDQEIQTMLVLGKREKVLKRMDEQQQ